jgi:toxin ParE1/3/4
MHRKPSGYQLSRRADADLDEIYSYTMRSWSVGQADKYVAEILAACAGIVTGEKVGRPFPRRPELMKALVGSHAIYFRLAGGKVQVVRILHQAMDAERHL